LRGNDGFEDREGHQAPFTLRIEHSGKSELATAVSPSASNRAVGSLRLLNRLDGLIEIRPLTGFEFGMEQFAIGANFEGAAARWNQCKRFNALTEFENFGRQTDGLRRVISNDAVFD
jgi:hypothetical protein